MDISVIIVNYNTKDLLLECVDSVYSSLGTKEGEGGEKGGPSLDVELWVVDNGSTDGSMAALKKKYPKVKRIENKGNVGFARANNQALIRGAGRYAVLLNSDTIVPKGQLDKLVAFMDDNPKVGILGPQLLNKDGSKQNSIANYPTLLTELFNKSLLRRLFPEQFPGKEHEISEPIEVDSVIGACMVVRNKATRDAGLFDDGFFFFFEETDWCRRMRFHDWKVMHHPGINIYHLQGATAKSVNTRARVEYWLSRYGYFKRHASKMDYIMLVFGLIVKLVFNIAGALVMSVLSFFTSKKARGRLFLNLHLLSWHLAGCPALWGLRGRSRGKK
ncbi:hypothetical protein MNBD_DELTA01-1467 [hydrothermal vent metagenome]|uniref:Glycosyltransferase 2-like domain-containing protein n=1 Tax=hydrothermal vent metagenome TaxID=652676 RepID=A0A3B0QNP8_9ZZZZ